MPLASAVCATSFCIWISYFKFRNVVLIPPNGLQISQNRTILAHKYIDFKSTLVFRKNTLALGQYSLLMSLQVVTGIFLHRACGYSSQVVAANFTQQDSFVKTILCCRSLFCGNSTGLWVLWHFNQTLSAHNWFSALCAKQICSGMAQGEHSLLLQLLSWTAAPCSPSTHSMESSKEISTDPKAAWKILQRNNSTICLSLLAFLWI